MWKPKCRLILKYKWKANQERTSILCLPWWTEQSWPQWNSKNLRSSLLSWIQASVDYLVLVTDVFQYGTFESIQPEVAQWSQPWTYSSGKRVHCCRFHFYHNQCTPLFASFFNTLPYDNHKSNSQPYSSESSLLQ